MTEAGLELLAGDPDQGEMHEEVRRLHASGPGPKQGSGRGRVLRERMEAVGAHLVGLEPGELPDRLAEMGEACPAPLFTTNAPRTAFAGVAVAVVGTRRATAAGLELAQNLGAYLARAGVVVVSGLARGIDAAAHRGVVAEGGRGLAVLGSGIDVVYPRRHGGLADELRAGGGGLVSQYAPGAEPFPWRFPRRNRLLAALADAVVVVEAHTAGGALITAEAAGDLGIDVMAVPGSPLVPASAGTNRLLRDGAGVVSEFRDVLTALGLDGPLTPPPWAEPHIDDPLSRRLLELMGPEPLTIDTLVRMVRRDAVAVSRALARLEIAGAVVRQRGGVRRMGQSNPA